MEGAGLLPAGLTPQEELQLQQQRHQQRQQQHQQQQQQPQPQQQQQQQQQAEVNVSSTGGAGAGAVQSPRPGKAWYLDAPQNEASPALLAELGIMDYAVRLENGSADVNIQLWKLAQSRLAVHSKSGNDAMDRGAIQIGDLPTTAFTHDDMEDQGGEARFDCLEGMYCVWGGEAFVDVRDWADCWVRIRLHPGNVVLIPPNRFHRATPKSPGARLVQVRVKTGDGGVNVEIRDPRTAPPLGSSGTMAGDPRELVASLCRQFYHLGWVTGTGGSISIRHGNRIFMTPSGVQKERLRPSDLFVLDRAGMILSHPRSRPGAPSVKISACLSLFQHAYRLRDAGAVIHSHGIYCVLAAMLCERKGTTAFRITHQEMIKGMEGHGFHDELVIPVIDNTAHEADLADSLADAITKYPESNAVLVQRHGCYVWGPSWEKAKTQSECLHYLLEAAVKMDAVGFDPAEAPRGGCQECGAGLRAVTSSNGRQEARGSSNGVVTGSGMSCGPLEISVKGEMPGKGASTSIDSQGFNGVPVGGGSGGMDGDGGPAAATGHSLPLPAAAEAAAAAAAAAAVEGMTQAADQNSPAVASGPIIFGVSAAGPGVASGGGGSGDRHPSAPPFPPPLSPAGLLTESEPGSVLLGRSLMDSTQRHGSGGGGGGEGGGGTVTEVGAEAKKRRLSAPDNAGTPVGAAAAPPLAPPPFATSPSPVPAPGGGHPSRSPSAAAPASVPGVATQSTTAAAALGAEVGAAGGGGGGGGVGVEARGSRGLPASVRGSSGSMSLEGVKVVLLDIEGTTTPITFVKDTLFPYARERLVAHLKDNWENEDLQQLVQELKAQAEADAAVDGAAGVPQVLDAALAGLDKAQASVAEYVRFVMSADRKLGPLKSLQGHIWRQGYADGGLVGEVYEDVKPAFERWTRAGKRLSIYSSGSREAQRLLFSKSTAGDLRPYLSAYFDTSIGGKREAASYREICLSLGVDSPSEILFLTDLIHEAAAAKLANLRVVVSVRPGNDPLPDKHPFETVTDFNSIG
ncbi:unnamed protein product [Scytosiphon promiscuus]